MGKCGVPMREVRLADPCSGWWGIAVWNGRLCRTRMVGSREGATGCWGSRRWCAEAWLEDPGVWVLWCGSLRSGAEAGLEDPDCSGLLYSSLRSGAEARQGPRMGEYTAGWRGGCQGLQGKMVRLVIGVVIFGWAVCDRVAVVECGSGP